MPEPTDSVMIARSGDGVGGCKAMLARIALPGLVSEVLRTALLGEAEDDGEDRDEDGEPNERERHGGCAKGLHRFHLLVRRCSSEPFRCTSSGCR